MKKLLLKFGIIQRIGLIFKLTLCVRLLLVYKRLQSFSYINAFINVYYNFLTFITSMIRHIHRGSLKTWHFTFVYIFASY